MKYSFKSTILLIANLIFIFSGTLKLSSCFAKDLLEINLDKEIKKGNFLIGLKRYLGNKNESEDLLRFKTENDFLEVQSLNGVIHQSKEIKILLQEIPLEKPFVIERLVSKPYASYESAKKAFQNLQQRGFNPQLSMPKSWELSLPIQMQDQVRKDFRVKRKIVKNKVVPYLINKYTYQKLDGPISINSVEDIKINNIKYGKNFYLIKDSYGTWTLVQKIPFNKYLNGVLPHEIGANSPIESLKAQAVIARTWAIYNSKRFEADNFHLCITTQCQVYKPSAGNKNIKQAILDTRYQVLTYSDRPINAFYHASNGGISANASESWRIKDYPYLISNVDLIKIVNYDLNLNLYKENQLLSFLQRDKNDFFGKDHYLFRWQKKVSATQINNLLIKNNLLKQNGAISNIKVISRGVSGRVTKLEISQMNAKIPITLVKDEIRKYLNFLPSNLFVINKLNDNFWLFNGGGFGHGVGLSQSGAIEMAKKGFPYQQILKHYYKDTKILNFLNIAK